MSSSGYTEGIAYIDVTSAKAVNCTQRVRSRNNSVTWLVRNLTDVNVTVELRGFRPVVRADEKLYRSLMSVNLTSGPISPDHRAVIRGDFTGRPGDVIDYDVVVNGATATDPQIEI